MQQTGMWKQLTRGAGALIIIAFFLPWVSVSCSADIGTRVAMSGYQLAAGINIGGVPLPGSWQYWLVPLGAIVAAGATLAIQEMKPAAWTVLGSVLLPLFVMVSVWQGVQQSSSPFLSVQTQPGLWLSVAGLLGLLAGGTLGLTRPGWEPRVAHGSARSGFGSLAPPSEARCPHCGRGGIRPGMMFCPSCAQPLAAQTRSSATVAASAGHGGNPGRDPADSAPRGAVGGRNMSPAPTRMMPSVAPTLGWLVVKAGNQAGQRFDLYDETEIGRDARCQVILDDDYVSRSHARVKLEDGQFVIYDVGSGGGTFVNERRVQRLMLTDGVEIRLGHTTLEFKRIGAPTT